MKIKHCLKCKKRETDYLDIAWERFDFCYVCQDAFMLTKLKMKKQERYLSDKLNDQLVVIHMFADLIDKEIKGLK